MAAPKPPNDASKNLRFVTFEIESRYTVKRHVYLEHQFEHRSVETTDHIVGEYHVQGPTNLRMWEINHRKISCSTQNRVSDNKFEKLVAYSSSLWRMGEEEIVSKETTK